jgi:hypothetical protein
MNQTISPQLQAIIDRRSPNVPIQHRPLYLKVLTGKPTRTDAVKAFCLECVGWAKKEVANCSSIACPLHSFRPFQSVKVEEVAQ